MAKYFRKPNGEVFEAKTNGDVSMAEQFSYSPVDAPTVDATKLQSSYSSWASAAEGFVSHLFPGAEAGTQAVVAGHSPEGATAVGQNIDAAREANPWSSFAGQLAGDITAGAAIAAAAVPVIASGPLGWAAAAGGAAALGVLRYKGMQADELARHYVTSTPAGQESITSATIGKSLLVDGNGTALLSAGLEAAPFAVAKFAPPLLKGAKGMVDKLTGAGEQLTALGLPKVIRDELAERGLSSTAIDLVEEKNLLNVGKRVAKVELENVVKESVGTMNRIKLEASAADAVLGKAEWSTLSEQLLETLSPYMGDGRIAGILDMITTQKFTPYLGQLQNLKTQALGGTKGKSLGALVETLRTEGKSESVNAILHAYDLIDNGMQQVARQVGTQQADDLVRANARMSAALRMKDRVGMEKTGLGGIIKSMINKGSSVLGIDAPLGGFGGSYTRKLGDVILGGERAIVNSAIAGFNGAAGQVADWSTQELTADMFSRVQSTVQQAQFDRQGMIETVHANLERQGIEGPEANAAVLKTLEVADYLNSKSPKTVAPGSTLDALPQQLTRKQLKEYNERLIAATNPAEAIKNPTPRVMETLSTLYPETLAKVQALANELQASHMELTPPQKAWLAKVTGIPKNKLAIPANNAIMNAGVQAAEAAGRAPAPYAPQNRSSEMTTSQRLAGGVNEE